MVAPTSAGRLNPCKGAVPYSRYEGTARLSLLRWLRYLTSPSRGREQVEIPLETVGALVGQA